MMGLINEEFDKIFDLSNEYNKDVEDLQKLLVSKNYYIGGYGKNNDGIDGKYGRKTRSAHKAYLAGIPGEVFNSKIKEKKIEKSDNVKVDGQSSSSDADVILMGGLDYRSGDKNISQQVEILKSSTGKNVIGHRYNDLSGTLQTISKFPNSYVVLFSAGCSFSSKVASLIKDKTKLFIVEPFASSSNTASSVKNAVSMGVPNRNVITGPSAARGAGVVSGSTNTPSGTSNWGALKFVGSLIK